MCCFGGGNYTFRFYVWWNTEWDEKGHHSCILISIYKVVFFYYAVNTVRLFLTHIFRLKLFTFSPQTKVFSPQSLQTHLSVLGKQTPANSNIVTCMASYRQMESRVPIAWASNHSLIRTLLAEGICFINLNPFSQREVSRWCIRARKC